jgi:hypothetical protein
MDAQVYQVWKWFMAKKLQGLFYATLAVYHVRK